MGIAAKAGHLGLYVMSPSILRAHAAELAGYDVGKGCIRFSAAQHLPAALVRKLVAARVLENEGRSPPEGPPATRRR